MTATNLSVIFRTVAPGKPVVGLKKQMFLIMVSPIIMVSGAKSGGWALLI